MKTTLFSLLIALVCDSLLAETIDVNGRFRSPTPGGFPDAWVMHEWGGYKPFPTVKTIPNACEGNTALSITDVLGDDGGAIQTRAKFPARSGSVGRISLMAKGKGLAWATFYRWGEKGQWNGVIVSSPFALSETWQPHVLTIPIDNGHACETHAVTLAIGGKMGAEIQVCNLTLDIRPAAHRRRQPLPKSWTIFGPVAKDFKPSPEQLQSIPERSRRQPKARRRISSPTRWISRRWSVPARTDAHGRSARIEAKYDCEMTVGAGAAGSMQYYLNGEPVFDIPAPGNATSPVEIDNHVKNVRLKAGDQRHRDQDRHGRGRLGSETRRSAGPARRGPQTAVFPTRLRGEFRRFFGPMLRKPAVDQGKSDAGAALRSPDRASSGRTRNWQSPARTTSSRFPTSRTRTCSPPRESGSRISGGNRPCAETATFEIAASDMTCRICSQQGLES